MSFSRFLFFFFNFLKFFFSVSRKVFSDTPLLSSVFVGKVMCAYLQDVEEMRRFYPVNTVEYLINLQWRRKSL